MCLNSGFSITQLQPSTGSKPGFSPFTTPRIDKYPSVKGLRTSTQTLNVVCRVLAPNCFQYFQTDSFSISSGMYLFWKKPGPSQTLVCHLDMTVPQKVHLNILYAYCPFKVYIQSFLVQSWSCAVFIQFQNTFFLPIQSHVFSYCYLLPTTSFHYPIPEQPAIFLTVLIGLPVLDISIV